MRIVEKPLAISPGQKAVSTLENHERKKGSQESRESIFAKVDLAHQRVHDNS